jgi:hypothetical protein
MVRKGGGASLQRLPPILNQRFRDRPATNGRHSAPVTMIGGGQPGREAIAPPWRSTTLATGGSLETRHFICLLGSGSRRQIRQHFHPGTLYIPSEHYRTDAKPPPRGNIPFSRRLHSGKKVVLWGQGEILP